MFTLITFTLNFNEGQKIFITIGLTNLHLRFIVEGWSMIFEMRNLEF